MITRFNYFPKGMIYTMNEITIRTVDDKQFELLINTQRAIDTGLAGIKNAYISFGSLKHYVEIRTDDTLPYEEIVLCKKLLYELHMPDYPKYEMLVRDNEIIIGPLIGLLMSKDDSNITAGFLNRMLVYMREYESLHGAVVVFALNKVDMKNTLIEGYCYNPVLKCFTSGVFPYPGSIYRTIGLGDIWKNHFLSVIGDKLFNNHYFNKRQMHGWLSDEDELRAHIPETIVYEAIEDIFNMLDKYGEIYIKPVSGLGGRGIIKIIKEDTSYLVRFRDKGNNIQESFNDRESFEEFTVKLMKQGRYIIQRGIKLIKYNDGLVDFRCIMQKNQQNRWVCNAIIGRNGERDSIVSNISSGGHAFNAFYLLRKSLKLPENDIKAVVNKIEGFACKVCGKLDDFGLNLGTLGLDIGIDENMNIWLIEINNRDPDPTIALDVNDMELYYSLKTSPLFYAKYLAGFKD